MKNFNERAILCERNYQGKFDRMALSLEEFNEVMEINETKCKLRSNDISEEWTVIKYSEEVTLYCRSVMVGEDAWVKFFTDMQYGLPKQAIAEGKYSAVAIEAMGRMRGYITEEGSRMLYAWNIARSFEMDYKECFTEDGRATDMLIMLSKMFASFINHELGFDNEDASKE